MEVKNKVDYESDYHVHRHPDHFDEEYYNARAEIALEKFYKGIELKSKLLDFGCGLGQNILLHPNAEGYDISKFSIDFCLSKGIKATTDLASIPNNHYDYVFSSHVLEHHPNPKEMLADMKSKLKEDGVLLLVIPYERHGKAKFELDLNQHLFCWNFQTINNLLISSGFEILSNNYIYGAGYQKLLPLHKLNKNLYWHATNLLSVIFGIKELMITARKL